MFSSPYWSCEGWLCHHAEISTFATCENIISLGDRTLYVWPSLDGREVGSNSGMISALVRGEQKRENREREVWERMSLCCFEPPGLGYCFGSPQSDCLWGTQAPSCQDIPLSMFCSYPGTKGAPGRKPACFLQHLLCSCHSRIRQPWDSLPLGAWLPTLLLPGMPWGWGTCQLQCLG